MREGVHPKHAAAVDLLRRLGVAAVVIAEDTGDKWREIAACRDEDPELFFPVGYEWTEHDALKLAEARAVCVGCPVVSECLAWAYRSGENVALLAGLTPRERMDPEGGINNWEQKQLLSEVE